MKAFNLGAILKDAKNLTSDRQALFIAELGRFTRNDDLGTDIREAICIYLDANAQSQCAKDTVSDLLANA